MPVARQGERAVHAPGGHLEGVGHLAHHVGVVEHAGHLTSRVGDVVEGHAPVLVDGDAQHAALAGGGDLDGLDVEAHRTQGVDQLGFDAVPGGVLTGGAHGAATSSEVVEGSR
jgi:hypothetical protein